ncbi:neurotrophin 1, partial [Ceratina calcarata]|uniref:Neurotrophin 1 n=2 Tax=Ceratina calcarata TaxID=156304 RepID=A0AAJ7NFF8_9HYME
TVVLLSSINVFAEDDPKEDHNNHKESNGTTTSIKTDHDTVASNGTDKIQGSRKNSSRELSLPKSEDIAKIISEDATGDEETPEELPEFHNRRTEAITRSLRSNKEMVAALLADYKSQDFDESGESLPISLPLENKYENRYESNEIRRRSDVSSPFENVEEGFTCPSVIKYARPQLARAASGIWKYIINTGEHTQTLRLEKCSNPQTSCSFISENYRSSCVQVYNYHRLLTWDSKLGLHMDIFKVPTCCSCHVHGYTDLFPPHHSDPPPRAKESFPGSDFATTDQKDDFENSHKLNYLSKFANGFDSTLDSSNKKPTIDSAPSRPTFTLPVRPRPKKPSTSNSRPFDKLPQQHAPNTRAPGYTGPLLKGSRPTRNNRPYRRESTSHIEEPSDTNKTTL